MFSGFGTTEVVIIAVIIVLLFGGKKIPELVRGVTDAIREFRKASQDKSE